MLINLLQFVMDYRQCTFFLYELQHSDAFLLMKNSIRPLKIHIQYMDTQSTNTYKALVAA